MPRQASPRVWLDVPFAEKDDAKAAGARWDFRARRWWAPAEQSSDPGLARWLERPLPTVLPGENRLFHGGPPDARIFADPIPASCWFSNVRSHVSRRDWERIRRMVYTRAYDRCEACGRFADRTEQIWLEAHERWEYDLAPSDQPFADLGMPVQRLRRLICLCTLCHEATHIGLAGLRGRDEQAMEHMMDVNRWDRATVKRHVADAFLLFEERSQREWALDLGMLLRAGIEPLLPS